MDSSLYRDPSTLRRAGEKEARSERERERERERGRQGWRERERERARERERERERGERGGERERASERASKQTSERGKATSQYRTTQKSVCGDFYKVYPTRALTFEKLRTGRNYQKSVQVSIVTLESIFTTALPCKQFPYPGRN